LGEGVEVIAKLDARNAGAEILADIHKSMVKAHGEAMVDYRKASGERHALLRKMMPDWRLIQETLGRVNKSVASVIERSLVIDRHMQDYETIVHGEDRAAVGAVVLITGELLRLNAGARGGDRRAAVNFTLIARPMAEMVGGTNFIGVFRTADIAALVIIMSRSRWVCFSWSRCASRGYSRDRRPVGQNARAHDRDYVRDPAVMASIEAGLAYMREVLLQDELATNALLRSDTAGALVNAHLWITTMAQMGMGFILPFALVFAAIPLETFVHSLRTVVGLTGIGCCGARAYPSRYR